MLTSAFGARALTIGSDVLLGSHGRGDSKILAHELTHVAQQAAGFERGMSAAAGTQGTHEAEAHRAEETGLPEAVTPAPFGSPQAADADESRLAKISADPGVRARLQSLKPGEDIAGPLFEEVVDAEIRRRLATGEGIADLIPKGKSAKGVEYIPGSELRGPDKRKTVDGMLVRRRADGTYDVLGTVQAKAGQRGAVDLHLTEKPSETDTPEAWRIEQQRDATKGGGSAGNVKAIETERGGQVGETIEKLAPGIDEETTTIYRYNPNAKTEDERYVPMKIRFTPQKARTVLATPSDVNVSATSKALKRKKIVPFHLRLPETSAEVGEAAEKLRGAAAPTGATEAKTTVAPVVTESESAGAISAQGSSTSKQAKIPATTAEGGGEIQPPKATEESMRSRKIEIPDQGLAVRSTGVGSRLSRMAPEAAATIVEIIIMLAFDVLMAKYQQYQFEKKLRAMQPEILEKVSALQADIDALRQADPGKPVYVNVHFVALLSVYTTMMLPSGVTIEKVEVSHSPAPPGVVESAHHVPQHAVIQIETRFTTSAVLNLPGPSK